ncbi:hypothetical protein BKA93DRAFT_750699 [Sparassis latifolia]
MGLTFSASRIAATECTSSFHAILRTADENRRVVSRIIAAEVPSTSVELNAGDADGLYGSALLGASLAENTSGALDGIPEGPQKKLGGRDENIYDTSKSSRYPSSSAIGMVKSRTSRPLCLKATAFLLLVHFRSRAKKQDEWRPYVDGIDHTSSSTSLISRQKTAGAGKRIFFARRPIIIVPRLCYPSSPYTDGGDRPLPMLFSAPATILDASRSSGCVTVSHCGVLSLACCIYGLVWDKGGEGVLRHPKRWGALHKARVFDGCLRARRRKEVFRAMVPFPEDALIFLTNVRHLFVCLLLMLHMLALLTTINTEPPMKSPAVQSVKTARVNASNATDTETENICWTCPNRSLNLVMRIADRTFPSGHSLSHRQSLQRRARRAKRLAIATGKLNVRVLRVLPDLEHKVLFPALVRVPVALSCPLPREDRSSSTGRIVSQDQRIALFRRIPGQADSFLARILRSLRIWHSASSLHIACVPFPISAHRTCRRRQHRNVLMVSRSPRPSASGELIVDNTLTYELRAQSVSKYELYTIRYAQKPTRLSGFARHF